MLYDIIIEKVIFKCYCCYRHYDSFIIHVQCFDNIILIFFSVINRNRRMPSIGSNQILNSIATKQVNKVKPNVNRQPLPDGVIVSPSSYNRYTFYILNYYLTNNCNFKILVMIVKFEQSICTLEFFILIALHTTSSVTQCNVILFFSFLLQYKDQWRRKLAPMLAIS